VDGKGRDRKATGTGRDCVYCGKASISKFLWSWIDVNCELIVVRWWSETVWCVGSISVKGNIKETMGGTDSFQPLLLIE